MIKTGQSWKNRTKCTLFNSDYEKWDKKLKKKLGIPILNVKNRTYGHPKIIFSIHFV